MSLLYLDASALVKAVRGTEEEGAAALGECLQGADLISSELVLTEVPRALQRTAAERPRFPLEEGLQRAAKVLDSLALRPVDDSLLVGAGLFGEPLLRSLDAIHIVTALLVSPIDLFVTYDRRQAAAARRAGLETVAPGAGE
jgi:predicted nucleic acid-binding protein